MQVTEVHSPLLQSLIIIVKSNIVTIEFQLAHSDMPKNGIPIGRIDSSGAFNSDR